MIYSEKMHKMKKRAESVKVALENVRTGEEDTEDKSEELAVDVPETSGELDENSSLRTEETSDDRSEDPESSPTKVILREADLIKFTKPFEIYLTPLTKEEIDRYTKREEMILSSSSSDSEFDEMVSA